ncbi:MAG: hypothetical protein ABUS76_00010 [Candidatus Shikimatogenerans sp. Ttur]|uniref:50S ribosomal protein L25 n=1 Tax=Candidatus Shikimatogenerans sp. Ttur TaxID=3158569 RepID=A0AAU7ZY68_9FLAO
MLTIISLKNKGYSKNILFKFIKQIGFSKRNVNINLSLLNNLYKKSIDIKCLIVMVIDEPLKIIINNNKIKYINYKINKHKIKKIFYKKKLYINKYDFIFFKKKNIYKLSFDKNIRLKQIGIIKILKIKYNFLKNKINKIYCKIIKYKNKIKIITIQ